MAMGAGAIYPSPRAGQYTIGEMETRVISPPHEQVDKQLWRWKHAPYIPPHALVNKQLGRWEQAPYIPPHELVNIQLGRWE